MIAWKSEPNLQIIETLGSLKRKVEEYEVLALS